MHVRNPSNQYPPTPQAKSARKELQSPYEDAGRYSNSGESVFDHLGNGTYHIDHVHM